jgi:hypothetical protein
VTALLALAGSPLVLVGLALIGLALVIDGAFGAER